MAFEYWNMGDVLINPPFQLEQASRTVHDSMEGTTVTRTFGINDYKWVKQFAHYQLGGVNPVNPRLRLWPKRDSYLPHCYCLEWMDKLIGETEGAPLAGSPEIQLGGGNKPWGRLIMGSNSGVPFYANIEPRGYSGGLISEPHTWIGNEDPRGGAWLSFQYRSIQAPFISAQGGAADNRYIGHYDYDWVDQRTISTVNSIQVTDFALGPRVKDLPPTQVFNNYKNSHGAISTATNGIEIKRLYVPAHTEKWIRKNLLINTLGKINSGDMWLPGQDSPAGQEWAFFRSQTLRFDKWESIPHQDVFGRIFFTIIMTFSENQDLGGPVSGHFGKRIGWNSIFDPVYYGFMRVSSAQTRTQWWSNLFFGGNWTPYETSLYELTPLMPWLFRIYEGGDGLNGADEPIEGPDP